MNRVVTAGIPDEMFERGNVPITKEEIRALVISKLRLTESSKVIDIGAGTGSITVECALIAKKGIVYSLEKNKEALDLIRRNTEKFKTGNVVIVEGEALETIEKAGSFDRAFIGGSGGNIRGILNSVHNKIEDNGRIVAAAITLDTLFEVRSYFKNMKYNFEIIQASITRVNDTGSVSMLAALNPVFIISAERGNL
jgi:precorrin-6Y C5,15-methyltransferase (decarboxylating) CbiT subunit